MALVTPNPLPNIPKGSLSLEINDFVKAPTTGSVGGPARLNYLYHADDGSGRLFVADSRGLIWLIDHGKVDPQPFLNLKAARGTLFEDGLQKGLRSFAFHPDYDKPGTAGYHKFYTIDTEKAVAGHPVLSKGIPADAVKFHAVLSEWKLSANDPTRIDPSSQREVLRLAEWKDDHNADTLMFNPNAKPGSADYGKMYITTGDGGNTAPSDPYNQAQDLGAALGKILRIDPLEQANHKPYGIPSDNPFVGHAGALPEVWALGFRHPQTLSFDTGGSGKMLIADMGQAQIEEIDIGKAGANYGWPGREGTFATVRADPSKLYDLPGNDASFGFTYPVAQYDHDDPSFSNSKHAVVGGFVYRGSDIPALKGQYLFGDLVNGTIYHVPVDDLKPGQQAHFEQLNLLDDGKPTSLLKLVGADRADLRFGEGQDGEIYIMTKQDGEIRTLAPASTPPGGTITGTNGPDVLHGTAHDDVIHALGGNDLVGGEAGNDTIFGNAGADRLYGSYGNDTIHGGTGADSVYGSLGNDKLFGDDADDLIYGGTGIDSLVGGFGNDRLFGEEDGDYLAGRQGADRLTGGPGSDFFDYNTIGESTPAPAGRDTIVDFQGIGDARSVDKVDLRGIDADATKAGNQAFVFRGTAAFTGPGQLHVKALGDNTLIEANTKGSLAADFAILVTDGAVKPEAWAAGDFFL
ncbi:MAG: PQQ-dependent sugar dehydrogenase [Rhodospirillales bacterium]|nr:PQQ-dependent sugar dehydrogenase [Rhodospirillales bacterium]